MAQAPRPLAVVTGASRGIGHELAKLAVENGYAVVVVANDPGIQTVAKELSSSTGLVTAVEADLATIDGVDRLLATIDGFGRPVEALFANAGRGLGRAFIDQDFNEIRNVIDTNITGTVYLIQRVAQRMRSAGTGKILITGSIAGLMPGSFQAVYNGTKAFIDSFAAAIRNELKDTGISITCLMPGATDTNFFERADMMDTKVGTGPKDDPADVAKTGFDALMKGEPSVVYGLKNKAQAVMTNVLPDTVLAEGHRKQAEPGTAKS